MAKDENGHADVKEMFASWDPSELDKLRKQVDMFLSKSGMGYTILLGKRPLQSAVNKCKKEICRSDEDIASKIKELYHLSGLKFASGKWTNEEMDIIKHNAREYLQMNNLTIDEMMQKTTAEKRSFFQHCSININRPYNTLYKKCLRMFDRTNHLGTYTPSEVKTLKKLNERYKDDPNKWKKIGDILGRSGNSVRDRLTKVSNESVNRKRRKLNWSKDEIEKLLSAVEKYRDSESSWEKIGSAVGSRSARECLVRYTSMKSEAKRKLTVKDELILVELLSKQDVNYVNEINWDKVSAMWPEKDEKKYTPTFLRQSFRKTVNFRVPLSAQLTFTDIIDILMTNFVTPFRNKPRYSSCDLKGNDEIVSDSDNQENIDDSNIDLSFIKRERHSSASSLSDSGDEEISIGNIKSELLDSPKIKISKPSII